MTRAPQPFWGRGAQGAVRLIVGNVRSFPRSMVTLRNSPFSENSFRRRITDQSTTIVLPRRALEREHPNDPGPNDVAAQMNAGGDEFYD